MAGTIFFMSYLLLVPLIFLNLFIAIILEGFETSANKEQTVVTEQDLEHFIECWSHFDKEVSTGISIFSIIGHWLHKHQGIPRVYVPPRDSIRVDSLSLRE